MKVIKVSEHRKPAVRRSGAGGPVGLEGPTRGGPAGTASVKSIQLYSAVQGLACDCESLLSRLEAVIRCGSDVSDDLL